MKKWLIIIICLIIGSLIGYYFGHSLIVPSCSINDPDFNSCMERSKQMIQSNSFEWLIYGFIAGLVISVVIIFTTKLIKKN